MNEPVKLEPCPFCGGEAKEIRSQSGYAIVCCTQCDIETPMFYDANGAVKAWNRRAERAGRWVPVVNTWTQDEHEYGATWYKCDQCGRLCETKQPYCHCGAQMIGGAEHA